MKFLTNKWVLLILVVGIAAAGWLIYRQGQQTTETVDYEVLYIEDAPAQIYAQYDTQRAEAGFSINSYNNAQYILITAGSVTTGGYDLEVTEVAKHNGRWVVKASLLPPDPDSFVTQAISYPAIVVKLPQVATKVDVSVDGEEYQQL